MNRGTWQATVHGSQRVGYNLVTKQQEQNIYMYDISLPKNTEKRYGHEAILTVYHNFIWHNPNFETVFVVRSKKKSKGIHQTAYNGYFSSSIDFGHSILYTFIFQIIHSALYCFHIWEKLYSHVKKKKKKRRLRLGVPWWPSELGFNPWSRSRDSVSQAVWPKQTNKKN